MKKFLFALLCIVISFATTAKGPILTDLKISGNFLKGKNISYTVCEINRDMSCKQIKSKTKFIHYSIRLELGKEYVITFRKNDKIKTLYVNVVKTGIMELDVYFGNKHSAVLIYDDKRHHYRIRNLHYPKYALVNNYYIASK
jgi:hypothetical protein